jgi:small subunit ribosomal protein S2
MKRLLETGVHFGHRTRRWNPKMKPYIFTERNGIHIIDLQQTLVALDDNYKLVRDTVSQGGSILFLGTKRQAQPSIAEQAARCSMPYVNERWLGGTLTNWRTIRQRIDDLLQLEERRDRGEFDLLTKKEALGLTRKIEKLNRRLGGIKEMRDLPNLLYVVDVRREHTAVHEANILNIPVIALVDTNCDPDNIDHIIPSNDDAIRAIKLITTILADAALEGLNMLRSVGVAEDEEFDGEPVEDDSLYLGEATLAKLRTGELEFEEKVEEDTTWTAAPISEVQAEAKAEAEVQPPSVPTGEDQAEADAEQKTKEGDEHVEDND